MPDSAAPLKIRTLYMPAVEASLPHMVYPTIDRFFGPALLKLYWGSKSNNPADLSLPDTSPVEMHICLKQDHPASYRIQVQGHLGQRWIDYLRGVTIVVAGGTEPVVTPLSGHMIDRAAPMGVLKSLLNSLYDLGYTLLFVECSY